MMSTRIASFSGRLGVQRRVRAVRSWSRRRRFAVGGAVVLLGILAACSSTNTYPIDYFSEMHYQESFRTFEPPRFMSPEGAVPVQGRAPAYTNEELSQLENPMEADEASIARGQTLFTINCAVCHGEAGDGTGPMASYFQTYGAPRPPANLTEDRLVNVPDSYLYTVVTNGLPPNMPPFANLIPGEDIWHLINYVRQLQGAQ